MAKSIDHELKQVRLFLAETNFVDAKKLLAKTLKKGALSDEDRQIVISFYYQMGEVSKALKIAGQEATLEEMRQMKEIELGLQVEVARLQHFSGARYSARRMISKIDQVIIERNLEIKNINIRYPLFKAIMSRIGAERQVAVDYSLEAMNFYQPGSPNFYNSWLNAVDCLLHLGQKELHETLFKKHCNDVFNHSPTFAGIINRHQSQKAYLEQDHEKALVFADESLKYFNNAKESVEYSVAIRCRGEVLSVLDRREEALSDLRESLSIVQKSKHSPSMGVKCLWEIYKIDPSLLSVPEKISLHCHPCFSAFSFFVGKQYDPKKHNDLSYLFKDFQPNTDKDAWYIDNGEIVAVKYSEKILELRNQWLSEPTDLFDCIAGIHWSKLAKVHVLPEVQLRTLIALWSSGCLGLNRWAIIDFIYREEPISFQYGEERLKSSLSQLKKFNFKTSRSDNFFYSEIPRDAKVLFPMEVASASPWRVMQVFFPKRFLRKDLESFFEIHKATANRWIGQWIERGLIDRDGNDLVF